MGQRFQRLDNPGLIRARRLRREMSEPEKLLWFLLRDRRFSAYKFRRQRPVGRYVVDFICLERMLVVELDGAQHGEPEQRAFDAQRTDYLKAKGYDVHRIAVGDLYADREGVLLTLWNALQAR